MNSTQKKFSKNSDVQISQDILQTLPLVAIVGRPNVGKSTIFNMLVQKRIAITHHIAGVTRDVVSAKCTFDGHRFTLQDTGGITDEGIFAKLIKKQSFNALHKASVIVFVVSVEELTAEDYDIAQILRTVSVPIVLVANKADNEKKEWQASELHSFGFGQPLCLSALHNLNIDVLCKNICKHIPKNFAQENEIDEDEYNSNKQNEFTDDLLPHTNLYDLDTEDVFDEDAEKNIDEILEYEINKRASNTALRLLILGKPNTGKSSLVNRIAGSDCMVSEIAGTTRDVHKEEFEYMGNPYVLIDSAGVRKKNKIKDDIEYYSIHRAIDAIEDSDVVLLLTSVCEEIDGDGKNGQFSEQDKKLISLVLRRAKAIIIGINKWDLLKVKENRLQAETDRIRFLLPQMSYSPVLPLSASTGYGIEELFKTVQKLYKQLFTRIPTPLLNRDLKKWLAHKTPPLVRGKTRRGKIKFISQVAKNPVVFKVYVNNIRLFPESYLSYVKNCIRKTYSLTEVPFHTIFSTRGK